MTHLSLGIPRRGVKYEKDVEKLRCYTNMRLYFLYLKVSFDFTTRLYYCNLLMYGVADGLMQRLQAVQNAAARLVTGTRRRDHITPILRQLHWLPVRQRVNFKLSVLVFKALHGLAPTCYLVDDCQLVTDAGRRRLRSSDAATCVLQRNSTRFGDLAFVVSGPVSGPSV